MNCPHCGRWIDVDAEIAEAGTESEPEVDALMERAGEWQARVWDHEVLGGKLSERESEAQQIIADLMLCLAHSEPTEVAPPGAEEHGLDSLERCVLHPNSTHELVCTKCLRDEEVADRDATGAEEPALQEPEWFPK